MKIILGSASPRRKELLKSLGYEFEVRTLDIDESFPEFLELEKVALYLAKKKANAQLLQLNENEILITADTTVLIDGEILGKPNNRAEAIEMLHKLSGKIHQVISGVFVCSKHKEVGFDVTTHVYFETLTDQEIQNYVDQFQPYDKAGSYGIQEWIGCAAIKKIEGSYNNVVGLPTSELYMVLKSF